MKAYTYLEVEEIEKGYDEQIPLKVIAESVNRDFHNGENIRTSKSISYVIFRLNSDDGWREKLETAWLETINLD